jgi:hypothetical protein
MTPLMAGLQVEFDQVYGISLIRAEGRLADESLISLYEASRDYSNATNARVSIVDLSSVSQFAVSSGSIQNLALRKLVKADAKGLCFIVAPEGLAFGLCRMFQIWGERTRPGLQIVHTLREAFGEIAEHFRRVDGRRGCNEERSRGQAYTAQLQGGCGTAPQS